MVDIQHDEHIFGLSYILLVNQPSVKADISFFENVIPAITSGNWVKPSKQAHQCEQRAHRVLWQCDNGWALSRLMGILMREVFSYKMTCTIHN